MTGTIHVLAGGRPGVPAPRGTLADLAMALAEHARGRGLAIVHIRCSRIRNSASKNIVLRDDRNRHWHLRVSDHYLPRRSGHAIPHFNLVTVDGRSGAEQAFDFVDRVAAGAQPWHAPVIAPKRRGQR